MKQHLRAPTIVAVVLAVTLVSIATYAAHPVPDTRPIAGGNTPAPTVSPTPTLCPLATPEPLWVEPVISPTELLIQMITVRIGNGEAVTITAESGVFTATGNFDAYGNPARVPIDLLANTAHHLEVQAKVREIEQWGCVYGGYTLYTGRDRYGRPLLIEQRALARYYYLPMILT